MATRDPSTAADAEFLGELRLGRHLTTTGQVAARGLTIVAALVVLMPGHLASLLGRSAALASLLAGIVLGLTLWNALELLGGTGDESGTHISVHQTLGGLGAFLTGWILWAGCAALLAALLRAAAEQALAALPVLRLSSVSVVLASGAAGAYAVAREDVAASLPRVGIAAALVPPLCAVGISLTLGQMRVASGAGLLFFTNLIAITLAGAVMLLLLGFRPGQRKGGQMAALHRGLLATVMLLLLIAIPLMRVFVDSVNHSRLTTAIKDYLNSELPLAAGAEWTQVEVNDEGTEIVVTATVYASEALSPDVATSLSSGLSQSLGRPVRLRLATILLSEGLSLPMSP